MEESKSNPVDFPAKNTRKSGKAGKPNKDIKDTQNTSCKGEESFKQLSLEKASTPKNTPKKVKRTPRKRNKSLKCKSVVESKDIRSFLDLNECKEKDTGKEVCESDSLGIKDQLTIEVNFTQEVPNAPLLNTSTNSFLSACSDPLNIEVIDTNGFAESANNSTIEFELTLKWQSSVNSCPNMAKEGEKD